MKTSAAFLAFLLLGACSKVKELDKRTQSMEKSTEKVSTITEEMQKSTDDLKSTTETMYQQIRSKEAEATREEKFKILMAKDADVSTRIASAGVFFKSLEYQLFTYNGRFDNGEQLNLLYVDAANEFTRRLRDLYEKINTKKMTPTTDNKLEQSFYAIAIAMHMNHHYQDLVMRKVQGETRSFYDLVKTALVKDQSGERLLEHEEILLNGINKEILIELLKARVDMLAALGLKNLTDKREMTFSQKLKGLIFKVTGGKLGSIDLPETYDKSNEATKIYTEKYLDAAVKSKTFLEDQLKIDQKLEKTIRSGLKNLDFNEAKVPQEQKDSERLDKIKGLINKLIE